MAITLPGTGTDVATENVNGKEIQQIKLIDPTPGSSAPIGTQGNPMKFDSDGITLLKRILQSLKSLGVRTGAGSNRLNIDVNNVVGGTLIATQATAANLNVTASLSAAQTLGTVTNQTNIGGISAWAMVKAMSRTGYNTGIRSKLG